MHPARFLVWIVLAAALAGCGNQGIPPASSSYATIQGIVTDATTGRPIAGAVVTVDDVLMSAPTGPDGAFTVHPVPSGPVDYSVQATGYAPATGSLELAAGATQALNVSLSKQ